jgi:hypothetical protein
MMLAPASIGVALADQLQGASPQMRAIVMIAVVVAGQIDFPLRHLLAGTKQG